MNAHGLSGWKWPSRRRGNFDFRSLVSTCEFAARDAWCEREFFGLHPMATYWWSCLTDAEGNFLAPMRKVNTELSGGLQLSSNVDEDNLEIAPDAFEASMRGAGVRWTLSQNQTSFRVAAPATASTQPFEITVSDSEFAWTEGDLLTLRGPRLGLGYQWYTPNSDERGGNLYVSQPFRVAGAIRGRKVRGIVSMDNFYGPTGQVYNNGPIFNVLELAWVTFANIYADGTHEFGALCLGKEHWGFAVVADQNGPIIETTEINADVQLDGDRYVDTAHYAAGNTEWRFTAAKRGQMRSLAAARGDAYHGQAGSVRRVGDERVPATSVAWIETFPLNGLDRSYSGQR
ncbi:hypothetical protein [Mycobacterium vicinigordonae]|uniref:DUF2804 domain-containing protein n=1 Tax=Mycobacterium vicinigordonae TaxID=1719132 RepID=A0A7D6IVR9_9MYCO|nr:hypothetical protein [Mycobacterium vicinigordonae]QLL09799.1 hypothetical protein H0P51_13640 [Mycobacterium vicinigordonae]